MDCSAKIFAIRNISKSVKRENYGHGKRFNNNSIFFKIRF
ncbi:MAG: hypothetical protein BAJALOKI2v1_120054 [Promethearchaeota archaeon]|nr:MAG: hypothetical protein BAJALOKI2v1_120054 [Candidatus Lokiarchaeota archaeon]